MKTLNELQPLIIEWANERDLIHADIAPKQRLKLIEECGELASAILKNDIKLQKDAIGDIFVVLVILNEQIGENLFFESTQQIKSFSVFSKISQLVYHCDKIDKLFICRYYLELISNQLSLDLTECTNIAWNEIKDRKGKTINGTFIKQS